jgi:hypothetical protein
MYIKTYFWLGEREVPHCEELPVNYENIVSIKSCEKGLKLKIFNISLNRVKLKVKLFNI